MRHIFPFRVIAALAIIVMILGSAPMALAQADPVTDMFNRINTARLAQGLPPYALNSALATAAERHSKDMATTGTVDHVGSDGTSYRERILAAGYGQWTFGPMVNESIYGGTGGADIAFDWWMSSDTHRGQLLSSRYREVGIAAVTGANGWTYWTLTLGAQPNILPAFVNDGATDASKVDVLITLTNENAVPAGEGTSTMGQALQVRLAHDEQFTGAEWQPWQARIPFQLLPESGEQRIYVQYRDAQGRTAVAWTAATLTNVPPTASPTLQPSATSTPLASAMPTPSDTPTPGPTSTARPPTSLSAPTSTAQPLASVTATPALVSALPTLVLPIATATRTPRPRPSPHPVATSTPFYISLNGGSPPSGLALVWLILQGIAIVLGVAMIARRPRPK